MIFMKKYKIYLIALAFISLWALRFLAATGGGDGAAAVFI